MERTFFLSNEELRELTGKLRSDAQQRELAHLGVPFRVRRDGTLVVVRADLEARGSEPARPEPELEFEIVTDIPRRRNVKR
jgi:hypothetical protein